MPAEIKEKVELKQYEGIKPDWCPGCGDFAVLNALKKALVNLNLQPHDVMVVSGIGCSSNISGYVGSYGMHTLHGRSIPLASAAKLSNHAMTVIAAGGDGDGYGIGVGHFIHACRRNYNLTYIVMNNSIYGLTTGQASPTSSKNMKTKSTPQGNPETDLDPLSISLAAGATFVARGFSGNIDQLTKIFEAAITHKGFAHVDVYSPCVTFNKINTYPAYRELVYDINEAGHDSSNLVDAFAKAREATSSMTGKLPTGIFYQTQRPTYDGEERTLKTTPLVKQKLGLSKEVQDKILHELR